MSEFFEVLGAMVIIVILFLILCSITSSFLALKLKDNQAEIILKLDEIKTILEAA